MFRKRPAMLFSGPLALAVAILAFPHLGDSAARAKSPRSKSTSKPTASKPAAKKLQVVAVVNRQEISRKQLGDECLFHYGEDVLESLVNKFLIAQECKRRGITVGSEEVDAEISRMAKRFSLPKDRWLKLLEGERGIKPAQYANDIIWPTLALRRLAGERLKVTREELSKAFETRYGDAIDARLISCETLEKAKQAHAAVLADPKNFGNVAKEYSTDASASVKGRIQPIRRHGSYKEIEQAVFNMKDGEISEVISAGGQYVVLQRVRRMPGAKAVDFERVAPQLEELVRDSKMRKVSKEVFRQLQEKSEVINVWNDPQKRREMPGVAVVINGRKISERQLAEECIKRHGAEVLEGAINRKLLEQASQKRNIKITEADLDREIAQAAEQSLPLVDGKPDIRGWLKLVTKEQAISVEVYRRDSVWPSVALRKLAGKNVKVSDEDLKRGFEANYGPRVRCRAIVLDNLRRAQKVWKMAREKPTVEYFGELAEQYSSDSTNRALRGEVAPIRRHGGQPRLEKEAFSLKPGEISAIINIGENYVILLCVGKTTPIEVDFESVRDLIEEDLREKKMRLEMARYFEKLQESAAIDNYLAGTTQRPKKSRSLKPAANVPTLRQVPAKQ